MKGHLGTALTHKGNQSFPQGEWVMLAKSLTKDLLNSRLVGFLIYKINEIGVDTSNGNHVSN